LDRGGRDESAVLIECHDQRSDDDDDGAIERRAVAEEGVRDWGRRLGVDPSTA